MRHPVVLLLATGGKLACLAFANGAAAAPGGLQAPRSSTSIASVPFSPPTLVFCGDGNMAAFGSAPPHTSPDHSRRSSVPTATSSALRTITLADGSGSLTLAETRTK